MRLANSESRKSSGWTEAMNPFSNAPARHAPARHAPAASPRKRGQTPARRDPSIHQKHQGVLSCKAFDSLRGTTIHLSIPLKRTYWQHSESLIGRLHDCLCEHNTRANWPRSQCLRLQDVGAGSSTEIQLGCDRSWPAPGSSGHRTHVRTFHLSLSRNLRRL